MIGVANGHQRGLWLSLAQYLGLLAGVIAGASLAPVISDALGIQGGTVRPLGAALVLVVFGSIGSSLGYWIGRPLRSGLLRAHNHPRELESLAGALFSGLAVLSVAWFLGLSFDRTPIQQVAGLIQRSVVLRRVDQVFPRPPSFLTGVERVIASVPFPQTFAGLEPQLPGALPIPANVNTPGVQAAQRSTFRVESRGCGGLVTGSAFPYAPNYLVTNAHVVSGTARTSITSEATGTIQVRVVLFDAQRDVAVLYAPGLAAQPLQMAAAGRSTEGAVIGYPGGGAEDVEPAVIDGSVRAQGRDIYNQNLVERQIWVVEATVRPGNSGGPLVDLRGRAVGLIFAASSSEPHRAYALTADEIGGDLQQAAGSTTAINLSQYPCAV